MKTRQQSMNQQNSNNNNPDDTGNNVGTSANNSNNNELPQQQQTPGGNQPLDQESLPNYILQALEGMTEEQQQRIRAKHKEKIDKQQRIADIESLPDADKKKKYAELVTKYELQIAILTEKQTILI